MKKIFKERQSPINFYEQSGTPFIRLSDAFADSIIINGDNIVAMRIVVPEGSGDGELTIISKDNDVYELIVKRRVEEPEPL